MAVMPTPVVGKQLHDVFMHGHDCDVDTALTSLW